MGAFSTVLWRAEELLKTETNLGLLVYSLVDGGIIFTSQSPDHTVPNTKVKVHLSVLFVMHQSSQMQTVDYILSQTLPGRSDEERATQGLYDMFSVSPAVARQSMASSNRSICDGRCAELTWKPFPCRVSVFKAPPAMK